jgi:glycosyltransferase involved in cell wall biosynthesis
VVNRGVSFPLDVLNKWKYRHPRVAAVICVADAVRKVVMRTTGIEPGLVQTIYGSTDTGKFDPDRIDGSRVRRELGLGPDDLVIGQVSVRDWKGWSDLVAAFAQIKDRLLNVRLLFVGCETEADQS